MLSSTHPVLYAIGASLCAWAAIALGALIIFTRQKFSRRTLDLMLALAGGMMLGAAFWSLLLPSLALSAHLGRWAFAPALLGVVTGALFLRTFDMVLPHLHVSTNTTEGLSTHWRRSMLLVTAMALHHIPEGLALGISYGATGVEAAGITLGDAGVLTASIMLQNIPEGLVVSTALRAEGCSRAKACFWGVMSGCTMPLGALPGALAADITQHILPVTLAFAAGAMLYVIVEDVIPESQASGNTNTTTLAFVAGLLLVMCLTTIFK